MNAPPVVSVVLPYRDVETTLEEAASSILSERDLGLELLLVDDGSVDGSPAIAALLADADRRVRLLACGGAGLVAALNLGLAEARSDLVARMDGDDVSLPGRLEAQVAAMRAARDLVVLGTRVEAFPAEIIEGGLARYVAWQNGLLTPEEHARQIFVEAPLCHPSVMMRRGVVLELGGYRDGMFPEDYDLWLRLVGAGHAISKLPQVFLRWRQRAGRLTFNDPRYSLENIRALRAEHLASRLRTETRALVLWGAGPTGRRLARAVEAHGLRFVRFVDIDPKKIGRVARGAPITSMDGLSPQEHFVVAAVGAEGARALIQEALDARAFVEGRDFVAAA